MGRSDPIRFTSELDLVSTERTKRTSTYIQSCQQPNNSPQVPGSSGTAANPPPSQALASHVIRGLTSVGRTAAASSRSCAAHLPVSCSCTSTRALLIPICCALFHLYFALAQRELCARQHPLRAGSSTALQHHPAGYCPQSCSGDSRAPGAIDVGAIDDRQNGRAHTSSRTRGPPTAHTRLPSHSLRLLSSTTCAALIVVTYTAAETTAHIRPSRQLAEVTVLGSQQSRDAQGAGGKCHLRASPCVRRD